MDQKQQKIANILFWIMVALGYITIIFLPTISIYEEILTARSTALTLTLSTIWTFLIWIAYTLKNTPEE